MNWRDTIDGQELVMWYQDSYSEPHGSHIRLAHYRKDRVTHHRYVDGKLKVDHVTDSGKILANLAESVSFGSQKPTTLLFDTEQEAKDWIIERVTAFFLRQISEL